MKSCDHIFHARHVDFWHMCLVHVDNRKEQQSTCTMKIRGQLEGQTTFPLSVFMIYESSYELHVEGQSVYSESRWGVQY